MRKLIGMVDFVLQDKGSILNMQYANFLKQPLELGMFVACCQDGNILEDPEFHEPNCKNEIGDYDELRYEYQQAQERVLFEGFKYCESQRMGIKLKLNLFISPYTDKGRIYLTKKKTNGFYSWFQLFTIEDLIQCDLTLTDYAIKKLGL